MARARLLLMRCVSTRPIHVGRIVREKKNTKKTIIPNWSQGFFVEIGRLYPCCTHLLQAASALFGKHWVGRLCRSNVG